MRLSNTPSVALSLLLAGSAFAKYESCSLLGPDVPIPKAVSQSSAFKDALVSLKKAISDAIGTGKTAYGNLDASETSFSLDIFSVHEEDALFTYHYDAPELPDPKEGVKKLDSNSIYRLGSISKLLTMQIFLATVGDISFNEPITKYIPELAAFATQHAADDDIDFMDWDSVTIGALASQLGGIPRDIAGSPESDARAIDDLPDGVPAPIFSPLPENITDAECPNFDAVPCTRAGVLGSINVQHPAFAPSWGPAYSNVAYTLLQYALEDMSKQSFPDLFASKFIKPLQLKDTYYSNAPISQGIIPYNDTEAQYTNDLMALSPGGGFYSTTNDMRAIGKAILNSTLLSPAQTRRWMKPLTFTANDAVLAPLPERATWMYTKGGDIGVYSTQIILLPDYGIGFNILAAGDKAKEVNPIIADFVAAIGIPAFEQAAKEEAGNVYAGTYTRPGSNDTLVLAVDKNPGLLVSRFLINGTDVVTSFGGEGKQLRVVPSGLHGGKGTRQGFRVVLAQKPSPEGAFVNTCTDWYIVSADVIAGVSLDDIVITLNADGDKAVEVNARGYRVAYSRS